MIPLDHQLLNLVVPFLILLHRCDHPGECLLVKSDMGLVTVVVLLFCDVLDGLLDVVFVHLPHHLPVVPTPWLSFGCVVQVALADLDVVVIPMAYHLPFVNKEDSRGPMGTHFDQSIVCIAIPFVQKVRDVVHILPNVRFFLLGAFCSTVAFLLGSKELPDFRVRPMDHL